MLTHLIVLIVLGGVRGKKLHRPSYLVEMLILKVLQCGFSLDCCCYCYFHIALIVLTIETLYGILVAEGSILIDVLR